MAEHDCSFLGLDNRPVWFGFARGDNRPPFQANTLLFSHHPLPSGNFWTNGLFPEQGDSESSLRPGGPARAGLSRDQWARRSQRPEPGPLC